MSAGSADTTCTLQHRAARNAPAVEKRLIQDGEIETWVMKSFGGDRLILVPSPLPGNVSAAAARLLSVGQDPSSKM